MNKDKMKGTIDDAAGRAKRQFGEWTGDSKTQVEGALQQVKGKVEKAVGAAKDAAHNAEENARKHVQQEHEQERRDHEPHAYSVNRNSAY